MTTPKTYEIDTVTTRYYRMTTVIEAETREEAEDILRVKYDDGEITLDNEEYMRDDLQVVKITEMPHRWQWTSHLYTNAPKAYDYGYTRETHNDMINPCSGHEDMRQVVVESDETEMGHERWVDTQSGRYQSGMYVVLTAAEYDTQMEQIDKGILKV